MLSNNIVFDTMLMSSIDGVKWHCKDLWKVPDLGCNLICEERSLCQLSLKSSMLDLMQMTLRYHRQTTTQRNAKKRQSTPYLPLIYARLHLRSDLRFCRA